MSTLNKRELEEKVEQYRELWLNTVSKLNHVQTEQETQREVIIELYYGSHWDSDRLQGDTAGHIWTKVKEAFNLTEKGPDRIMINDPQVGD